MGSDNGHHGVMLDFSEGPITPTTGAEILDKTTSFIRRFVSLSDAQVAILALWVVHTHCFDAWQVTPYLAVTSAEKRCGKSRLLEVLELVVNNPWKAGKVSVAVLIRKIAKQRPTCLLDEIDAAFKSGDDYSEALRGILNCGFQDGNPASLCVGQGAKMEMVDFPVFCPKVLAGIGTLPDTVGDRSIPIRLKRQSQAMGRKVERFRLRDVRPQAKPIRDGVTKWACSHKAVLAAARPAFPIGLTDRQEDVCEPLLAIADAAGGDWPSIARQALVTVFGGAEADDESTGVKLLGDIKTIFDEGGNDKLSSSDLVSALVDIETSPWAEFRRGDKPLSTTTLSRLLKRYEIYPRTIRLGAGTAKGYDRAFFVDAWTRYLPTPGSLVTSRFGIRSVTPVTMQYPCGSGALFRAVTRS